jgi:phage FluMu protein Com
MSNIKCHLCDKPLTGGTDTFGEPQFPQCLECWYEWRDEHDPAEIRYMQYMIRCATCRQYRATVEEVVYDAVELAIIEGGAR